MNTTWAIHFVLAALVQGSTFQATPMDKVVTLLKNLATKISSEGAKEAAEYDKHACFCKEQADNKQYSMETSDEHIRRFTAERDQLKADVDLLTNQAIDLGNRIADLEGEIEDKTRHRSDQHGDYLKNAQDMSEAIGACRAAIDALKNSKKEMLGAKLDLMQVTNGLVKVIKRQPLLANQPDAATLLSKLGLDEDGSPKYEYHSNDIVAVLQDLFSSFNLMKRDLDGEEYNVKAAFDATILGLVNEKKFAQKGKDEKLAIADGKSATHADRMDQIKDELEDNAEDKKFMMRLTRECEKAAEVFDQRSQIRSSELSALVKATGELETGAVQDHKANELINANKDLVGGKQLAAGEMLQTSAIGKVGKRTPVTLVQISSLQQTAARSEIALERVHSFLIEAAGRTDSSALSAIAERVGLAAHKRSQAAVDEDPFASVRGLIEDLLNKLQGDATSEATTKENCDEGMKKTISNRDKGHFDIETATAKLTVLNSNKNELEEENVQLSRQIADLKKAKVESALLTAEEIANLEEQMPQCEQGTASVELALTTLNKFYSTDALAKTEGVHGRHESEEYQGAQYESKGIIGILEVIVADFQRTLRQAKRDKEEAQEMQDEFEKETELDIKKKTNIIEQNKAAENGLVEINQNIAEQEQELHDANELLDTALKALEGWSAMCVQGEETWEERVQKRDDELEALKQAVAILNDWQA